MKKLTCFIITFGIFLFLFGTTNTFGQTQLEILQHWAPEVYQDVNSDNQSGRQFYSARDIPVEIDFDEYEPDDDVDDPWYTGNNWDNSHYQVWEQGTLTDRLTPALYAAAYASFVETQNFYFLGYGFYHAGDDSNISSDRHENDWEMVMLCIKKDGSAWGSFQGMLTQFHSDHKEYDINYAEWNGSHPMIYISANGVFNLFSPYEHGHGIESFTNSGYQDNQGDDAIVLQVANYGDNILNVDIPGSDNWNNARRANYKLISINELWAWRNNNSMYKSYTTFQGGVSGVDDGGNPPWDKGYFCDPINKSGTVNSDLLSQFATSSTYNYLDTDIASDSYIYNPYYANNSSQQLIDNPNRIIPSPGDWLQTNIGAGDGISFVHRETFTLSGLGNNFGGTSDNGHFLYRTLQGDGEIVATIDHLQSVYHGTKAGIMMRESLDAGSKNVFAMVFSDMTFNAQVRASTNGSISKTETASPATNAPVYLKINRTGDIFTTSYSSDGVNYTQVSSDNISMNSTIYVGMALSSRSTVDYASAMFYNVSVSGGTTPNPPVADFSANVTTITEGGSVNFTDNSSNSPTSWSWTFEGGSPSGSSSQNPTVTYNTAGTYDVTLTATNSAGNDTETKTNYITVNPAGGDDYAPLPYSTGFESGSIDQYWTLETENSYGRIEVSSGNSPNGSYHLISDVTTNGNYSTNAGLLHVDLAGYTTVDLSFVWKEFSDEDNTEDGVYLSDNGGSNFTKVYNLTGGSSSYTQVNLDIDQLASSNGLNLTSTFIIKFQHRDNYTLTTDGMAWDDISVTGSTNNDPPSPATSPNPANGATDVSLSAQLSWTAGAGATSHDVYFGTDATPDAGELQGNQAGTSFNPGTLAASTTYYWRIDEVNAYGTTTGTVWSFTTGDGTSVAHVGYTDIFGSTSTSGNRRAMPFNMPEDGTIESISMYHTGGSGDMILAVYDGSSAPNNRLGVTPTTVVSGSTGWQTIDLTSPVSVTSGTQIWLGWVYESNPGIRYQTGSPGRYDAGEGWSGGMPDPFGGGSQADYLYSIYATYTSTKSKAINFESESLALDNSDNINIYPNPAYDILTIESPGNLITTIDITDIQGRLVYQNTFINKININTSDISGSGILFIKLATETNTCIEKLIIK